MKYKSRYFVAVVSAQNESWGNSFKSTTAWIGSHYGVRKSRAKVLARACVRLTNLIVSYSDVDNTQPSDVDVLVKQYMVYNSLKLTDTEIIVIGYEIYDGFFRSLTIEEYSQAI